MKIIKTSKEKEFIQIIDDIILLIKDEYFFGDDFYKIKEYIHNFVEIYMTTDEGIYLRNEIKDCCDMSNLYVKNIDKFIDLQVKYHIKKKLCDCRVEIPYIEDINRYVTCPKCRVDIYVGTEETYKWGKHKRTKNI